MIGTEFYWTVVVAFCGAFWAIASVIRDRKAKAVDHSRSIIDRLLESDRLIAENPDIRKYLSATTLEDEEYFRNPDRLNDEKFFKAKPNLYSQLNMFDEILSVAVQAGDGFSLLRHTSIIEMAD